MLKITDVLKLSYDDFRLLLKEEKYKKLIRRKMKIIISMALSGKIVAKGVYLIERVGEEPIDDEVKAFVSGLSMEWCETNHNGEFSQFRVEEAEERLKKIQPGEIIMLREFVYTEYCGYATTNCDGNTLIEVKKGGFYSFWEAREIPTHYIVDKHNNTLVAEEKELKYSTDYDYDNRKWIRNYDEDGELVALSKENVGKIRGTLMNVCEVYKKAKIAWILCKDEVVVFDIWIMFNQGILE